MKDYIEERTLEVAKYIIANKSTVRDTAKVFGCSKSTIHKVKNKRKGFTNCILQFAHRNKHSNCNMFKPQIPKKGVAIQ